MLHKIVIFKECRTFNVDKSFGWNLNFDLLYYESTISYVRPNLVNYNF